MAVERGYFDVPRKTTLEELADELDISRQALSEHVRRGTEKILRRALLGLSTADVASADTN
jgi:predicted DNA binding protein